MGSMTRHMTTAEPGNRVVNQVRMKKVGNLLTYEKPYIGGRAQSINKAHGIINNYLKSNYNTVGVGGGASIDTP